MFGELDNGGREPVSNSAIAGHVAGRAGAGMSAAGDAADAVFEAIAEALSRGEEVRIAGMARSARKAVPRARGASQGGAAARKI